MALNIAGRMDETLTAAIKELFIEMIQIQYSLVPHPYFLLIFLLLPTKIILNATAKKHYNIQTAT